MCSRNFHETNFYVFSNRNYWVVKTYNKIWDKVCNSNKKGFDSKPGNKEKYLKTKTKSYEGKINTRFNWNGIPKEGSQWICLLIKLIVSTFKNSKNSHVKR